MTRPGVTTAIGAQTSVGRRQGPAFFNNNFDLLRIVAATQVLIVHSCDHLSVAFPPWLMFIKSFPGVPIFFVTSGFLISASYQRSPTNWSYARNRIRRIFPALWLALLLTSVTVALLGYKIFSLAGASWLVAQCVGLIYTPGFLRSFGFGSYNGALWTIPVELQFYLVLPVLCYVLSGFRSHTAALLGAFLVFVLLAVLSREYAPSLVLWDLENEPLEQKLLRYSFIPNFFLFLSGALAYRLSLWAHPAIYGKALFWFCAVALFAQFVSINSVTQIIWYLLLAGFTLSAAYTCVGAQKFLHGQDISYGVYIYHGLILNLLVEFGCKSNPLFVGVVLINSYVVAFLSWHLVERPCLKFKFKPGWPRLIVRDNRPMAPIA